MRTCLRIEATSGINSKLSVSIDWGFTALNFNVVVIPGCFGRWYRAFLWSFTTKFINSEAAIEHKMTCCLYCEGRFECYRDV